MIFHKLNPTRERKLQIEMEKWMYGFWMFATHIIAARMWLACNSLVRSLLQWLWLLLLLLQPLLWLSVISLCSSYSHENISVVDNISINAPRFHIEYETKCIQEWKNYAIIAQLNVEWNNWLYIYKQGDKIMGLESYAQNICSSGPNLWKQYCWFCGSNEYGRCEFDADLGQQQPTKKTWKKWSHWRKYRRRFVQQLGWTMKLYLTHQPKIRHIIRW